MRKVRRYGLKGAKRPAVASPVYWLSHWITALRGLLRPMQRSVVLSRIRPLWTAFGRTTSPRGSWIASTTAPMRRRTASIRLFYPAIRNFPKTSQRPASRSWKFTTSGSTGLSLWIGRMILVSSSMPMHRPLTLTVSTSRPSSRKPLKSK